MISIRYISGLFCCCSLLFILACNNNRTVSFPEQDNSNSIILIIDSMEIDSIITYSEPHQNHISEFYDSLFYDRKDSLLVSLQGRLASGRAWALKEQDPALNLLHQWDERKKENNNEIDYHHFLFTAEDFGTFNLLFVFKRPFVENDTTAIFKNISIISDSIKH